MNASSGNPGCPSGPFRFTLIRLIRLCITEQQPNVIASKGESLMSAVFYKQANEREFSLPPLLTEMILGDNPLGYPQT